MAAGVSITIYERDYDYIYVEWTNAGVVKRGYIPRANTATTGYSWCSHSIFVPGKTTANKTVYYKPGGLSYGTVYANEYPLLILRQSGSYYFVQYTTNPDATGSTNPKFRRGWITTASVALEPPSAPNIEALSNNPMYALIRYGTSTNQTNNYLTVTGSSTSGYSLTFAPGTGNTNQQWKIYEYTYSGGSYYKIQSVSCGLYIEIDGRIPVLGTKAILAAYGDPQKAQEFAIDYRFINSALGYKSTIRTRCSGDYLVLEKSGSDLIQVRETENSILYIDPIDNQYDGTYTNNITALKYYIDSSVVYGNITENVVISAANAWNNISNISLTRTTNKTEAQIVIKGDSTMQHKAGTFVCSVLASDPAPTALDGTWLSGEVRINTNQLDSYCMTNRSVNDNKMNISHELGHALKMAHSHENKGSTEDIRLVSSIMNQGLPSLYSLCPVSPSPYDIRSLKIKWD